MASDSDLEAYLNQLSKKTHKLQQDAHTHGYSSSQLPSDEDKSDVSDLSDDITVQKQDGKSNIGQGISTADITALSDKYGRLKSNKTQLYDEFKSLEQKYLKKTSQKSTLRTESPKLSNIESGHKPSEFVKASKPDDVSDDSLVDDELARYLNENSIEDNPKEVSNQDGSVTESDEVLNLDNIMTVDDILGQMTDGDSDDANGQSQNKKLNYVSHSPVEQNEGNNSTLINSFSKNNSERKRKKSIFEAESASPFYSKKNVSTHESLLNSNKAGIDIDNDQPEGLLFAQVTDNIFHSSRRNSLMSPVFRRKSSSKSLLSESVQDLPNDSGEDPDEGSVAESVEENISVSHESSTAKSVAEASISEKVLASHGEDIVSDDTKSSRDRVSESKTAVKMTLKADKNVRAVPINDKSVREKKSSDSKRKLSREQSASGTSFQEKATEMKELVIDTQDSSNEEEEKKVGRRVDLQDSSDRKERKKVDRKSREQTRKADNHSYRKARRKEKKKSRRRSSSASSSSSSSSSSTSSSESSHYVKYKDSHGRHSRKTKNKHLFNPWLSNPYMPPWWWMQIQQHSFSASAETPFYFPNARLLEGLVPSSSAVGVQDIMRQQVALTRQFMESQKVLYHAYTATLASSYRYTSLRDTENYIRQRKHPLTFDEAYKLVKEEMKNAKK